jgi:hypothetical protein
MLAVRRNADKGLRHTQQSRDEQRSQASSILTEERRMVEQNQEISGNDFYCYPLNISRRDADDLHLYNQEFERKSATLFVQASTECKVELWQVANFKDRRGKCYYTSSKLYTYVSQRRSQKRPSVSWPSSLKDLQRVWRVWAFVRLLWWSVAK